MARCFVFGTALFLFVSAIPAAALDDPSQAPRLPAIGDTVPPYPEGVTSLQGACVSAGNSDEPCGFGLGSLERDNAPIALYAGRSAGHDEQGIPRWTITDTVTVPAIAEGYFLDLGLCRSNTPGLHPVAILRAQEDVQTLTDIAWAKAFDPTDGRFAMIDANELVCENPLP